MPYGIQDRSSRQFVTDYLCKVELHSKPGTDNIVIATELQPVWVLQALGFDSVHALLAAGGHAV
jgi:hypothetical protein